MLAYGTPAPLTVFLGRDRMYSLPVAYAEKTRGRDLSVTSSNEMVSKEVYK